MRFAACHLDGHDMFHFGDTAEKNYGSAEALARTVFVHPL